MGRVITIVAVNPHKAPGSNDEGDPTITQLMEILGPRAPIERAASVQEIRRIISKDNETHPNDPPELIQIIGHGEPGVLTLGAHWIRKRSMQVDNRTVVLVLDSDPEFYGILVNMVAKSTKVWLLGCNVGATLQGSTVANGPTLVFDLGQLWSCEVSAPVIEVVPQDFDDQGRYAHPERMITARGRTVTEEPLLPMPGAAKRGTGAENARLRP